MIYKQHPPSGIKNKIRYVEFKIVLVIITVVLLITITFGYGLIKAIRISTTYMPLVDAAVMIELRITRSHLWLEEMKSYDTDIDINSILKSVDKAAWYANAISKGGEDREGVYVPLNNSELDQKIKVVIRKIAKFRDESIRIVKNINASAKDISSHKLDDHIFDEIISDTDDVELIIKDIMIRELHEFKLTQIALMVLSTVLLLLVGSTFWKFYRQQSSVIQSLDTLSINLKEEIANREKSEEDRRILEKAVIDFEEQERQRIGHDLHDDVGQLLTGLAFKTHGLLEKLKDINGGLYREGEDISELIEQAKNKLRHLTKGLLPVSLSDMGLMESIEGLVSDIFRLFGIKCNFNCVKPIDMKNRASVIHLYRIAQEAVTNALKHAKADKIEISLDRSNSNVTMIIKDNGVGISESELSRGGLGVKIMEYRARLINASLNIYKDVDSGTVVQCVMTDS